MNGFGVMVHPDGTRHEAEYIDGKEVKQNDFNTTQSPESHEKQYDYEWEDGSYYIGDIVNGKPNGLGTKYCPNGKEIYGVRKKRILNIC